MIYLASPYSHNNPDVQQARYDLAQRYVANEIRKGETIFSPIVYAHPMAHEFNIGTDHLTWKKFNCAMIDRCDALHVLRIEGWLSSKGVQAEIAYAIAQQKDVRFVNL